MALTKAHNRMIADAAVNVKDFGAVGDGVADDTAAIQAALDSDAKRIYVPAASSYYKVTSALLPNSNQTIFGDGEASEIRQTTSLAHVIHIDTKSNVSIENLHIYAVGDFNVIRSGNGILIEDSSFCTVSGCLVENHLSSGVGCYDSDDCVVKNNTFINSPLTDSDTSYGSDVAIHANSKRNLVDGNNCKSGNGHGVVVQSISDGDACNDNVVVNNIVTNPKVYGIVAYRNDDSAPITQYVYRTVIANNSVKNVSGTIFSTITSNYPFGAGIYLQGAEGSVVSGNVISDTHSGAVTHAEQLAPGGIGVANTGGCSITGNYINSCGMYGLYFNDALNLAASNGTISASNNVVAITDEGGLKSVDANNVNLNSNSFADIGTNTGDHGIYIANTSTHKNYVIDGNCIRNGTGSGILVSRVQGASISNNRLDVFAVHGISAGNSDSFVISSNTVEDHVTRGIEIQSGCTQPSVLGNTIKGTGSSTEGIRLTSSTLVKDNLVTGCTSFYAGSFAPYQAISDGDTTPSVDYGSYFKTSNTSATSITTFDNGYEGQVITLRADDANTTLVFSASILLNGSTNFAMTNGSHITLMKGGSTWRELSRMTR
jgi:parallel beta-helix repeat protein